ncbi:hypothetical protein [Romboutsia sp.]|uniref:hypothetical protein n=1 Tax=Romboutsia sp. TaxID=1965302 RepID=UPI003F32EC8A
MDNQLGNYIFTQRLIYPLKTPSCNELSKCFISGTGKRISQHRLTDKDLEIVFFVFKFKVCSFEQIAKYLELKGHEVSGIKKDIERLSKLFGLTNIIEYTYINTEDKEQKEQKLKVVCLMSGGIHLVRSYTNYDVDENVQTSSQMQHTTNKRTSYNLSFAKKALVSIDLYLNILKNLDDKLECSDFRIKINTSSIDNVFIPADYFISLRENDGLQTYLVRSFSDMEVENLSRIVNIGEAFNRFIKNKSYINMYLPISNLKPRLIFLGSDEKITNYLYKIFKECKTDMSFIDVISIEKSNTLFENQLSEIMQLGVI